jgi:dolichol-phosphate mannosyltransferase
MPPMPLLSAGPPWLVLPTYNEADNLEALVAAALTNLPSTARVLVVDDDSPDGTGRIADRLAAGEERIEVLHRPRKEGLGPAYLDGFRRALEAGAGFLIEMDCDFSHDPADLPRLLAAAADADLAVGSRYIDGGGVENWTPLRKAVSRGGSAYSRLVLGLPIRDLTGGFKCFRREVLEAIPLGSISSRGYAFQVELTYRTAQAGFRIAEIPIVFHERRAGASKMSGPIVLEAGWKIPLLRLEEIFPSRRRGAGVL